MAADTALAPRIDLKRRRIYGMIMQSFLHQPCVTAKYLVQEVMGYELPESWEQLRVGQGRVETFIRELVERGWLRLMPRPDHIYPGHYDSLAGKMPDIWQMTFEGWVWATENQGAEYG